MTAEHAETREFLEIEYSNTAARSLHGIAYLNTAARSLQEIANLNNAAQSLQAIEYLNVPVLDLTEPSREQLAVAVAFIAEHAHRGGVYVHCALGISRSVAAAAAYIASQQTEPLPAPM
jgi:protein-tyrosine phosphatase